MATTQKTLATAAVMLALSCPAAMAEITRAFRDCANCALMVPVRPAPFEMGSPKNEPGHSDAESPLHRVVISHAFAISKFDITLAEFAKFADETGFDPNDPKCDWRAPKVRGALMNQTSDDPVVCVNWADAQAYVTWLRRKTGKEYRLPSEAEWEFAARAASAAARPWGGRLTRDNANYGSDACCGPFAAGGDKWLYTSPVGSFPPNAFGLYDMIGNVWQWVEDCGHDNYAGVPIDGSAWITGDCSTHIVRGGAWFQGPESARSASRASDKADFRIGDIGFRIARTL